MHLQNLTIKQQLLITTIIPILGLLYLSFNIITSSYNDKNNLLKLDKYLYYSTYTSNLIHHLQIERGMNSGFLQSKGVKFKKEIIKQRLNTDKALEELKKFVHNSQLENKENILKSIANFSIKKMFVFRNKISQLKTTSHENLQLYSSQIAQLIDTMKYFNTLNKSKSLSRHSLSYLNLILAKENAGQERAIISSIIISNKLNTEDIKSIFVLSTSQKNYINSFESLATKKLLNYYKLKLNTRNTKNVAQIKKMILSNYEKYNIISQMKSYAGYGGLIHNFKNYILRNDEKYKNIFLKKYTKLTKSIELYEKQPMNDEEKKHLERIRETFALYKNNIEKISLAYQNNTPLKTIDEMVKIDDSKALASFDILSKKIIGLDVYYWFNISTKKINALNQVENKVFTEIFKEINKNKNEISNVIYFQLIYISVFLIIIILLSFFIFKNITNQIKVFQNGLLSFFKYIKKENSTFELLNEKPENEFGYMSKVLNKGINHIVSHIKEEIHNTKQQEKRLHEINKIQSLGDLLKNIAHQWRQPLSVISTGITGMQMQKEYGMLEDKDFYKNCEIINQNVQHLSTTIDNFQKFMIENSKKDIFNLKDNVEKFLSLVEGTIKENNISIIISLDDKIFINSYSNELIQVFLNIFNNAKDALLLKNKDTDKFIFIKAKKIDHFVSITIKDNAGGISEKVITKIFEPYFTTKHESQGTGLGLHMTYNLVVDGMQGRIEAQNINYTYNNKIYNGAEFIITLPIS